jgi:hypothetical protein
MTHTVEIESARTVDIHGLLRALRSDGLVGEVVEIGRRFRLFVEGEDDAAPVALTDASTPWNAGSTSTMSSCSRSASGRTHWCSGPPRHNDEIARAPMLARCASGAPSSSSTRPSRAV